VVKFFSPKEKSEVRVLVGPHNMNKDLLMTYEEYAAVEKVQIPYTYVVERGNQYIYYFGSKHSFDPHYPQFQELQNFFAEFLKKSTPSNRVVIIEGGLISKSYSSAEQAILDGAETQFTAYLASKENIPVYSTETDGKIITRELMKEYSIDEIAYYIFARTALQYSRIQNKPDAENYVNSFLRKNIDEGMVGPYLFPNSALQVVHQNLFGTNLDINDEKFFAIITNPIRSDTIINTVCRSATKIRDMYVLEEIDAHWNQRNSVFVVYGSVHAVMQERAIKSIETMS
jgi:hypothetical protein